eukprot:scaffold15955_cov94-Phaeocystis_antarctica.AAC.3
MTEYNPAPSPSGHPLLSTRAPGWRPSAPRNQAAESGLRRIDVELAASLTSQHWSILSRGRLPDLGR